MVDTQTLAKIRSSNSSRPGNPDPEVTPIAKRRRFSLEYKRRIVEEADACSEPGEVGALLRREGLYSSLLTAWRRQLRETPKKRGRPARPNGELRKENDRLARENVRLKARLMRADKLLELQKKAAEIWETPLEDLESGEKDS